MKIVIPFVHINAHNPNINARNKDSQITTYHECIVVAFSSLRFWNPHLNLQLTTNRTLPEPFRSQLLSLNVNTKIIEYSHNPPPEFGDTFRGCFFLFDAISSESEDVLYLDPDVFCAGPIVTSEFWGSQIGALDLGLADDHDVNGITPSEARDIYSNLTGELFDRPHKHFGGEAVFIPLSMRDTIIHDLELLWNSNLVASQEGLRFIPTEEHLLSLIFSKYQVRNLNGIVLRIWTAFSYDGIQGGVFDSNRLTLWHLPAEKSYGFRKVYRLIIEKDFFNQHKNSTSREYYCKIFSIKRSKMKRFLSKVNYFIK